MKTIIASTLLLSAIPAMAGTTAPSLDNPRFGRHHRLRLAGQHLHVWLDHPS